MKKLRLTEPVTITGPDCFGRKAWLVFRPCDSGGWHWWHSGEGTAVTHEKVRYNKVWKFLYLVSGHNWLNIWEHIGVLRWTGLDGVFVSGTRWPPYFGRALEIWEKLAPYCTLTDEPMEWIRPRWKNRWVYANGRSGYVEIEPHKDLDQTGLDIEVKIDYLTLGEETRHFRLPCSTEDWHTMLASKSPGWPRWRYEVCCLAEKFGWPHMNSVTWPQEMPPSVALQQFALHRVGDLLGALSLVSSRKLLSGKVTSYCAGHEADLGLLGTTLWMPVKSKVAV